MVATNETTRLKEEMTSSHLYILAQGINSENFSGLDKCLYKCLLKSHANLEFCRCLDKVH